MDTWALAGWGGPHLRTAVRRCWAAKGRDSDAPLAMNCSTQVNAAAGPPATFHPRTADAPVTVNDLLFSLEKEAP
jgi:hypothetical protein